MEVEPFRHCVIDGFAPRELCRAASLQWPPARWEHWMRYDGREGMKFASRDAGHLPPACAELVRLMLSLRLSLVLGIDDTFPDFSLHGAGMHMIPPGGRLPLHLDGDHHPVMGWGRAASCVLWIDDWRPEWGGQLRFWGPDASEPTVSIDPQPGRLAIFECGDSSWHDVAKVAAAATYPRRSLAAFYWTETAAMTRRPRAEFVG
jgi:hypothetical protein